jgi:hypothetical protein
VIEYFADLDWTGPAHSATLHAILKGLIHGLRDPALPVQAAAACSLRLLIEAEGAAELLKPMLPEIVNEYFRIMEEVENESVLSALQVMPSIFVLALYWPYNVINLCWVDAVSGYYSEVRRGDLRHGADDGDQADRALPLLHRRRLRYVRCCCLADHLHRQALH